MACIRLITREYEPISNIKEFLEQFPHYVIRNLKGKLINFDVDKPYVPKSFADYFLYAYEHAFETDTDAAILVINFVPKDEQPCGVCGKPTKDLCPEPLPKTSEQEAVYAVCDDCWEDTHLNFMFENADDYLNS